MTSQIWPDNVCPAPSLVCSVRNLGVTFDTRLDFSAQIEYVVNYAAFKGLEKNPPLTIASRITKYVGHSCP